MATSTTTTLRAWRAANEMSLADVAGLTGYSEAYLSLLERDLRHPSPKAKVLIARRVGATVAELFPVDEADEAEAS